MNLDDIAKLVEILGRMRSSRNRFEYNPGSLPVVWADVVDDWADELEEILKGTKIS